VTRQNNNNSSRDTSIKTQHVMWPVLAVLLLAVPSGQASEEDSPGYKLLVRPSICVSYDSEAPCTMSMQVTWEGEAPADVCLRDATSTPMLHCWENSNRGSVAIDYANTIDVLYQLVEETSLGVLAEAEIKVINRDLRESRKRRRHVWSIL
jgi:hypothetical protein